jgi:hypothetical protein
LLNLARHQRLEEAAERRAAATLAGVDDKMMESKSIDD